MIRLNSRGYHGDWSVVGTAYLGKVVVQGARVRKASNMER